MSITHLAVNCEQGQMIKAPTTPSFHRFLIIHFKLIHCFIRCDHSFHWSIAKALSFRSPSTSIPNAIKDHACCNFCVLKNQNPIIQKTALNQFKSLLRFLRKWPRRTVHRKYFNYTLSRVFSQSVCLLRPSLSLTQQQAPEKLSLWQWLLKTLFSTTKHHPTLPTRI